MSNTIENKQLVNIEQRDFEIELEKLKELSKNSNVNDDLKKEEKKGGLFGWFSHKVTEGELTKLTVQIQKKIIALNKTDQELFDQICQVYNTLDALDKGYIAAILDSIKAIKEVNDKTLENQIDIQNAVENQEKTINVLKKFKADIDKLKHITDVDEVWELIEGQNSDILILQQYADELSQLDHLKDIDTLWEDGQKSQVEIKKMSGELQTLSQKVELQDDRITETSHKFETVCKETFDNLKNQLEESKTDTDIKLNALTSSQHDEFESVRNLHEQDKQLLTEQINSLNDTQEENKQNTSQALLEQNNLLNEQKAYFATKLKIAYAIAGGATAISLIHIVLSLAGLL